MLFSYANLPIFSCKATLSSPNSAKPDETHVTDLTSIFFKSIKASYTEKAGIAKIPKSIPVGKSFISVLILIPSISPLLRPIR